MVEVPGAQLGKKESCSSPQNVIPYLNPKQCLLRISAPPGALANWLCRVQGFIIRSCLGPTPSVIPKSLKPKS